jgi:hypothetical protein
MENRVMEAHRQVFFARLFPTTWCWRDPKWLCNCRLYYRVAVASEATNLKMFNRHPVCI